MKLSSNNLGTLGRELLKQFELEVIEMEVEIEQALQIVYINIVDCWPVDTGWSRSWWKMARNKAFRDPGLPPIKEPNTYGIPDIPTLDFKLGDNVFIYNPVRYAEELENGKSSKGSGCVKQYAGQFESILAARMRAKGIFQS